MNILEAGTIIFEKAASGTLDARKGGTRFHNVRCVPLFPHSHPDTYISVLHKKEKEFEEIGVIRDLGAFPADQRRTVEDDVSFRYFVPEIVDVAKINNKHGLDEWIVTTDRGNRTIQVRDRKEHVIQNERGIIFITDIDDCRYRISNIRALPEKAQERVERQIV
jgi:hypothetical protein